MLAMGRVDRNGIANTFCWHETDGEGNGNNDHDVIAFLRYGGGGNTGLYESYMDGHDDRYITFLPREHNTPTETRAHLHDVNVTPIKTPDGSGVYFLARKLDDCIVPP